MRSLKALQGSLWFGMWLPATIEMRRKWESAHTRTFRREKGYRQIEHLSLPRIFNEFFEDLRFLVCSCFRRRPDFVPCNETGEAADTATIRPPNGEALCVRKTNSVMQNRCSSKTVLRPSYPVCSIESVQTLYRAHHLQMNRVNRRCALLDTPNKL